MARFTQYIGLSKEARDFLDKHEHKEIGHYHMTEGIAMEEVSGRIIEVTVHKATEESEKYGDFMDTVRLFVNEDLIRMIIYIVKTFSLIKCHESYISYKFKGGQYAN